MYELSEKEKLKLADKVIDLYFNQNFGSTSKSDLETLLFSEYIEHCLNAGENFDDYTLSKQLGITQARIRTLKERKELRYPRVGFDWRESFAIEIRNAKYDENDHYVKVIVQDVNVMSELRHYIEEKGWYDECSLNRKLLRIPLDCFTEICLKDEDVSELFSDDSKRRLKKIGNKDSAITELLENFTKEGLQRFLMSASKEAITETLKLLPFGGIAAVGVSRLIDIIKEA